MDRGRHCTQKATHLRALRCKRIRRLTAAFACNWLWRAAVRTPRCARL
jgi:hypothetical protein